jgi:phage terminase large subunit-like protein
LQGRNPSLSVVDELHVVQAETLEAMALAGGTRARPLTLAISTAAGDRDGPMWAWTDYGRRVRSGEVTDPAFYYWERSAPDGCELEDETAWAAANPALGDFLDPEHLWATVKTSRENVFRRFHLNQFCGQVGSWLPWGLWESRANLGRTVLPGTRIVAGFDGSASGDSTALIGATVEETPHVFVLGLWENDGDPRWRVDRALVAATVAHVFDTFDVAEMSVDVFGWRSEAEAWAARWPGRVVEHPMNASRMGPATDRAYVAVAEGRMSHDGDRRLASHVGNAVAKRSSFGDVLSKDSRESPRRIDAAVGMVLALTRAQWHHAHPARRKRVASF